MERYTKRKRVETDIQTDRQRHRGERKEGREFKRD